MESAIVLLVLLGLAVAALPFVALGLVLGVRSRERDLRDQVAALSRRVRDLERRPVAEQVSAIRAADARPPATASQPVAIPPQASAPPPPPVAVAPPVAAAPPVAPPSPASTPPLATSTPPPPAEAPRQIPLIPSAEPRRPLEPIRRAEPPRPIEPAKPIEPPRPMEPARPVPPPEELPLPTIRVEPPSAARHASAPPPPPPAASELPSAAPPSPPRPPPPPPRTAVPPPPPRAAMPPPAAFSPPPPPRPPRPSLAERLRRFDWERIVGVKLFSILAGVVLAIAAVYAIILSVEAGVFTPKVRFVVLTAVGAALVVGSELRLARAYAATALPLAAGGIVTLFGTFYAGYALWNLWSPPLLTFALLGVVTAAAVALSIRRGSLIIAVLGLLGGFATPILVASGEDRPLSLFGYLLLLNVALTWVAYKRRWTLLPWLSLAFTAFYQAGWVGHSLDSDKIPLALGVFLVLGAVGFVALRLGGASGAGSGARRVRWAAAAGVPPALLALYVAANPAFSVPWPLLFGFLFLVAAGLAAVAAWQGPEWLHLGGAGFVLITAATALARASTDSAWPLALGCAVLAVVYVAGPFLLAWIGRPFRAEGRLAVLAAPLFAVYASFSPSLADRWPVLLGFLAAGGAGLAASALRERREWLHLAGAAAALVSTMALLARAPGDPAWPLAGAALLFAALYLGAPLLLGRRGVAFQGQGRWAVLAAPLLALYASANPALSARWPILFAFVAVASAALAALAAWQKPEWLHTAGAVAALLTTVAVLARPEQAGQGPLLAAILLLLAVYVALPLVLALRGRGFGPQARLAALAAPAFALSLALRPALAAHWPLVFAFLALAGLGLAALAVRQQPEWLHTASAAAALVAVAALVTRPEAGEVAPIASAFVLFLGVYLGAPLLLAVRGRPFGAGARLAVLVVPAFALWIALRPALSARWPLLFAFVALLGVGLSALAVRQRPEWLHTVGAATALLATVAVLGRPDAGTTAPLAAACLLLLAVSVAVPLWLAHTGRAFGPEARVAALAAPLLAVFLALNPSLAVRWPLFFGFLALVGLGLAALAAWQKPEWLHVAGAVAALFGTIATLSGPAGAERGALVCALLLFLLVYLGAPLALRRLGRPFTAEARPAALAGSLLAVWMTLAPVPADAPLLFAFLALSALGLAAVAAWQGPEWLHPAGAGLALVAVALHLAGKFTPGEWPLLALLAALPMAAYLAAPLGLARLGSDFRARGRDAVLAAPLLLGVFLRAAPTDAAAPPLAFLAPLLALAAVLSAWAVLRADARVHVLSSALAILAVAIWSGVHLDAERLHPALLAYLLLGGLLLAAPLAAERRARPLAGNATSPLLLGAMLMLVFLTRPIAGAAMGGLAGLTALLALLQAALFLLASRGRTPWLAVVGVVLGFLELAIWSASGMAEARGPALAAVAVLTLVPLAAVVLAGRQKQWLAGPAFTAAPFLALIGHLFILVVAVQRDLALPPAPWLTVLGVLDLGFLAAALLRRRGELALAAAAASVLVFFGHAGWLQLEGPTGLIGCAGAAGAAALFFAGDLAARRVHGAAPAGGLGQFGAAAAVASQGAQLMLPLFGWQVAFGFALPAQLGLQCALLALAWRRQALPADGARAQPEQFSNSGAEALALSSALVAGLFGLVLSLGAGGHPPAEALAVATAAWLVPLAYPLIRGARGRREWFPFLAAVLASGIYLVAARKALIALGAGPYVGALPVVEAALLVPHLRMLLRMEPPSERDLRRLALVAAAILGLVTVAIPLQLEKQWWTIGWALLGAALAWLWRRVPHRGLLGWATALLAASFVRLVPFFNVWIFGYQPRSERPIWNWYLYTYLVVAGAHLLASWWFSRGEDRLLGRGPRVSALAGTSGALLLFLLLNIEIADYWSPRGAEIVFRFSAGLGSDLTYTVGWAAFAIGLLTAGVVLRSRAVRFASIALLAVTVVKGFLHDLGHLTGLYRVGSFVGLAFSLAVVAVILQRFVLRRTGQPAPAAAPAQPPAPPPPPPAAPPESTP